MKLAQLAIAGLLGLAALTLVPSATAACVQPNSVCVGVNESNYYGECVLGVYNVAQNGVYVLCVYDNPYSNNDTCVLTTISPGGPYGFVCVKIDGSNGCLIGIKLIDDLSYEYFVCS